MKNKFYASLLVGIGLTVVAMPSVAKAVAPTTKKQVSSSTKPAKANTNKVVSAKKPDQKTAKKASTTTASSKQKSSPSKNQPVVNAKDSKHGKTKSQPLADAKDSKHGKTKAQQLADAKDSKHSKSKSQLLADAKDNKRGKSKAQQLADAKDKKHGKSKAQQLADAKDNKHGKHSKKHQVVEESYEEDASTAVDDEPVQATGDNETLDPSVIDQTSSNNVASHQDLDTTYSGSNSKLSSPLIIAPAKPNNPFSQLSAPAPLIASRTQPQAIDNNEARRNPFSATPEKTTQAMANTNRIHSSITSGLPPSQQAIETGDEEEPDAAEDMIIQANHNSQRVHSSLANNNFIDSTMNSEMSSHVASAHGIVDGSLTEAGEKAGLSNDLVIQMTDVFAWDIDFANNLQEGDQFTVIYEAAGKANSNQIIAAQFINRGKTYTAIRYKDKEGMIGYYTPDGRSLRKAFLTTPIDFARVSSHFDPHRRHPILNRIRAHKGVDYAARTGTPVKAAGDGVIRSHENRGAYGRMIVIAHGEHYETAYAHLSNFRDGLQDGEPVKQGDVIGYVGQSGLATGPHLHYEFRVDGVHRDPEKLDSKQAMRLPNGIWEDFHAQTIPVLTQLNQAKAGTLIAKNP